MLALTVGDKNYQFDPFRIEQCIRINAVETLLKFPDGGKITVEMPQDILFVIFNGRREFKDWMSYKGFRVFARRKDGNIWHITLHPLGEPDTILEAHFRSKDCAIFLPPDNLRHMPAYRIEH